LPLPLLSLLVVVAAVRVVGEVELLP